MLHVITRLGYACWPLAAGRWLADRLDLPCRREERKRQKAEREREKKAPHTNGKGREPSGSQRWQPDARRQTPV